MATVRVLVLDDHFLVREGIRSLLKEHEDVAIVGEGWVGEQLAPLIEEHRPDVVLLDLGMPWKASHASSGPGVPFQALPAIAQMRRNWPGTKFIIVSQYVTHSLVEGAVEAGADGYLLKDDVLCLKLIEAIHTVHLGGVYFSAAASQQLRQRVAPGEHVLSERQVEIIQAIAANPSLSYAEQARRLNISEHTLHNHLRQIFKKLGVRNITAAIVEGLKQGFISVYVPGK